MKIVRPFQALIGLVLLSSALATIQAQESEQDPELPRMGIVAVPSFQGELPDGTPVIALVIVPPENILNKNEAWQQWEQEWPTRYRLPLKPQPDPAEE